MNVRPRRLREDVKKRQRPNDNDGLLGVDNIRGIESVLQDDTCITNEKLRFVSALFFFFVFFSQFQAWLSLTPVRAEGGVLGDVASFLAATFNIIYYHQNYQRLLMHCLYSYRRWSSYGGSLQACRTWWQGWCLVFMMLRCPPPPPSSTCFGILILQVNYILRVLADVTCSYNTNQMSGPCADFAEVRREMMCFHLIVLLENNI